MMQFEEYNLVLYNKILSLYFRTEMYRISLIFYKIRIKDLVQSNSMEIGVKKNNHCFGKSIFILLIGNLFIIN